MVDRAKKKDVTGIKVVLKLVRLEIPLDYHRDLRVLAAKQGKPMAVLARQAMQEFIDVKRKKGEV